MSDRLARGIAAAALAVALVAVVVAAHAVRVANQYGEALETLGTTLRALRGTERLPLQSPPPTLDTDAY